MAPTINSTYRLVHLLGLAVSDSKSSSLIVETVRARDELSVGAGSWEPSFEVQLLGGRVVQRAGDDGDDAVGNVQDL